MCRRNHTDPSVAQAAHRNVPHALATATECGATVVGQAVLTEQQQAVAAGFQAKNGHGLHPRRLGDEAGHFGGEVLA